MKDTLTERKNNLQGLNSRIDEVEHQSSSLEYKEAKISNQNSKKSKELKNYGIFTQWNTVQQKERRSSYPLQQHGWNWKALC